MQVENPSTVKSYHCICEDYDIINDEIYPSVKKAITNIIKNEKYTSVKIQTKLRKTDGSNYMSKTFEVDIKGRTKDGVKETNLFIKQALSGDSLSAVINMDELFLKEIFYYTDLTVLYATLQKEAGIPSNQMLSHAKCFRESNSEAIIMENLAKKEFKMLHRMEILPLRFAHLSVIELAKFHALSFVMEKRKPKYFDRNIKPLKFALSFNEDYKKIATTVINTATERLDENYKNKIRKDFDLHIGRYSKYYTPDLSSVNCLCHGDFRLNNILAKEIDGEVIEVVPIDYQTLYYGSPMVDLTYLIYMNSDRTFRQNHENNLKNLYFDALKEFLKYFDVNIETVFPKKLFDEQYEKTREFGFYVCLFILPLVYAKENDLPDFESGKAVDISFDVDDKYVALMSELCEDFSYLLNP